MEINYFRCYYSYRKKLANLSDQEVGHLFRAVLQYGETGVAKELSEKESVAFDFIVDDIDREKAAYRRKCEVNAQNGARGGRPSKRAIEKTERIPENPVGFFALSETEKSERNRKNPVGFLGLQKEEKSEPGEEPTPPVIMLPLNDGTEYAVSQELFQELSGLYPAVDVMQQLRDMKGWLIGNPTRRKTRRGILRYITGWLRKQQDQGHRDRTESKENVYVRGEGSL